MGEKRRAADQAGRAAMRSPGLRRRAGWSIVSGSGRRSRAGSRARLRRWRRACRLRLASGGSGWVAGCRRSLSSRRRGGICRSRSARRSRCCAPRVLGCGRSRVSSISRRRRRFPGSCAANAATRSGGFEYRARPRSGMPTGRARRPKPAKLVGNFELRDYVQERLSGAVQRPASPGRRRSRPPAPRTARPPPPRRPAHAMHPADTARAPGHQTHTLRPGSSVIGFSGWRLAGGSLTRSGYAPPCAQ